MNNVFITSALAVALATTGCAANMSVAKITTVNPSPSGVVYRLPVPKLRVSGKEFSRAITATDPLDGLKWVPRTDATVDIMSVPSEQYAYAVSVEPGTFTLDTVGVTLGDGGVLDTFNGKSASQVKQVVESIGTLALTVASIALAASPPEVVFRPASPAENQYFQELLNMRARIVRRLKELDLKTKAHTLTQPEIDANKLKRDPLLKQKKALDANSKSMNERLDALQAKLAKGGLSKPELENLKEVEVLVKSLTDEQKGLDQKLEALAVTPAVDAAKLTPEEQKESTELLTLLETTNKKLDPDPDMVTKVLLFDIKELSPDVKLDDFLDKQTEEFVVVARRVTK